MRSNPVRYAPVFAVFVLAACNNFLNEWPKQADVNPVSAAAPVIGAGPQGARYNRNAAAVPLTVEAQNGERIAAAGGILSYQWYKNSANSNDGGTAIEGAAEASYTPPTGTAGTVYYYAAITNTIADNGNGGVKTASALSNAAEIVVDAKTDAARPAITGHPQGAVYRLGAEAAALTVTAQVHDGGSLSYQWYWNREDSNAGGTAIPGATGVNYTPPASPLGILYYCVEVTNTIEDNGDGGNKRSSARSNTAAIAVNDKVNAFPPVISGYLGGAEYSLGAESAALTVTAQSLDGGILSYQWYTNSANSNAGGTALPNETGESYTPSASVMGIRYYYVEITNTIADNGDGGAKSATAVSNAAAITVNGMVNALPPVISGYLSGAVYSLHAPPNALTVTAQSLDHGDLSYQWYSNSVNSNAGGTVIEGATGVSHTPSASVMGIRYYYVEVTNTIEDNGDGGAKSATAVSNAAAITVNDKVNALPPVISGYPQGAEYGLNVSAALTVTARSLDGGDLSYQWYSNSVNSNAGGTRIEGATGASYTPSASVMGIRYYYVEVTNTIPDNDDGGAKSATTVSNAAAITVNGTVNALPPVISGYLSGAEYSLGAESAALEVSARSLDGGDLSYQWYSTSVNSSAGGTRIEGATGESYTPPTGAEGTRYYYVEITNKIAGNGDGGAKSATTVSNAAQITVKGVFSGSITLVVEVKTEGIKYQIQSDEMDPQPDYYDIYYRMGEYPVPEGLDFTGWARIPGAKIGLIDEGPEPDPDGYGYSVAVIARKTGYDGKVSDVSRVFYTNLIDLASLPAYADIQGFGWQKVNTSYSIGSGANVTIKGDDRGYSYHVTVSGSGPGTTITLDGVNLITTDEGAPLTIGSGLVTLNLVNSSTLTASRDAAAIHAGSGTTLTITGSGSLTAVGGSSAAGIGGGNSGAGGVITISGGTVNARGGKFGAGIGGGDRGAGGTITITGGTVNAQGGENGAGIGGGDYGAGGVITITGGTVNARGGENGAGIGGGNSGAGGDITISGGTVIAQGSEGIGGGSSEPGAFNLNDGYPVIFASSIPAFSSPWPNGIARGDIETPGTFPSVEVWLHDNFTVPAGATLTIPSNMTLNLNEKTLTNNGTVNNQGRVELNSGAVDPAPPTGNWTGNPPQ